MKSKQQSLPGKSKKNKSKRVSIGVLVSLVVLAIAIVATIALPRNSSQASQKKYRATRAIIVDKATGQLRKPTPEETDAMVARISTLTNRSSEGLKVTQTASGMKMADLQGRFSSVVLGRANPDGTTEVRCVFTMEEAADFLGLEQE